MCGSMAAAEGIITFRQNRWRLDRRPELRRSLGPRRSDKCKSWYIAACIAGGVHLDRLASQPARIAAGVRCSTLPAPPFGNSDEAHWCTLSGVPACNRSGVHRSTALFLAGEGP